MLFAIQLCEKCNWIGTYDQCIKKHLSGEDATVACPRCKEYTVVVSLRLSLKELLKGELNVRSPLE